MTLPAKVLRPALSATPRIHGIAFPPTMEDAARWTPACAGVTILGGIGSPRCDQ